MTETKQTPGPWWLQPNDRHSKRLNGEAKGIETKSIGVIWHGNEEEEANARLIAAAPELLEAAKIVRDALFEEGRSLQILDLAIAKAEGRK